MASTDCVQPVCDGRHNQCAGVRKNGISCGRSQPVDQEARDQVGHNRADGVQDGGAIPPLDEISVTTAPAPPAGCRRAANWRSPTIRPWWRATSGRPTVRGGGSRAGGRSPSASTDAWRGCPADRRSSSVAAHRCSRTAFSQRSDSFQGAANVESEKRGDGADHKHQPPGLRSQGWARPNCPPDEARPAAFPIRSPIAIERRLWARARSGQVSATIVTPVLHSLPMARPARNRRATSIINVWLSARSEPGEEGV